MQGNSSGLLTGEADTQAQMIPSPRFICAVDLATGADATVSVWVREGDCLKRVDQMEARWTCQECGGSFRKQIDVECQVWLADDPRKLKRVCAACHKRLTREKKIIREAK